MKKSFVSLVGWMLTVCMLLGMMSFSAIAENAVKESIRTVFENGAGDEVYGIADGALRAVTYYSSNEEKEVENHYCHNFRDIHRGIVDTKECF